MASTVMLWFSLFLHLLVGTFGKYALDSYQPDNKVYGSSSSYYRQPYSTYNNYPDTGYYGYPTPSGPDYDYCRPKNVGPVYRPYTIGPTDFYLGIGDGRKYLMQGEVDAAGPVIITYSHDPNLAASGYDESRTKLDFTGQTLMVIKVYRAGITACVVTEYNNYCYQDFNFFGSMVHNYIRRGSVYLPYKTPLNYRLDGYMDREALFREKENIAKFCEEAKYVFHMAPGTDPNPKKVLGVVSHAGLVNLYVGYEFPWG